MSLQAAGCDHHGPRTCERWHLEILVHFIDELSLLDHGKDSELVFFQALGDAHPVVLCPVWFLYWEVSSGPLGVIRDCRIGSFSPVATPSCHL